VAGSSEHGGELSGSGFTELLMSEFLWRFSVFSTTKDSNNKSKNLLARGSILDVVFFSCYMF
jgi:hypothetical protein